MDKTRFDISCQNFDNFFANQIPNLTPEAKDGLPRDIIFKLFRRGGEFNSTSTSKLNFISKLYILCRSLKKRWYLVIEDEENGLRLDQYKDIPRLIREREYGSDVAKDLVTKGGLIFGSKELCDGFAYLNRVSMSPAYNYLTGVKNMPKNPVTEADKKDQYVIKFLLNWESKKKDIVSKTGLSIPEIYVLLALYHGQETPGVSLYTELFKRAYQSSPGKIKTAFGSLQQRGYIIKYGFIKASKLQITGLGKDVIRGMLDKFLINL